MQNTFNLKVHNVSLQAQYWHAEQIKDVIVLVHGMGEHMLRYDESVIEPLVDEGYAVVAFDLFGHGRSHGKRGYAPSYEALLDALEAVINKASQLFKDHDIILYGHSLGGNIVANYVLRRSPNIKAAILSSPFLRLAFQPPKWKLLLGKMMLKLLPSLTLTNEINPSTISRDSIEVERYRSDPLVHNKISPIYAFPVMKAGEWAIHNANRLESKMLLLHGTGDQLIDSKGSLDFSEKTECAELRLFENGYHELHHDLCKKEFIETVLSWLNKL